MSRGDESGSAAVRSRRCLCRSPGCRPGWTEPPAVPPGQAGSVLPKTTQRATGTEKGKAWREVPAEGGREVSAESSRAEEAQTWRCERR